MPQTVFEQFRQAALKNPELPFLCYPSSSSRGYLPEGGEFSYGEGLRIIEQLARRYAEAGYTDGHRVASVIGSRPDHFWHLLALNSIGASVVLLNPEYTAREMAFGIDFPDCSVVLTAPPFADAVQAVAMALNPPRSVIDVSDLSKPFHRPAFGAASVRTSAGEREALVIYTSGTTARPKGCIISNASCLAAGECYATAGGLVAFERGKDRLYIPLPTFHMNVSVYTLNSIIRLQNCVIIQDRFSASRWWSDIIETEATCFHYMGIIPPILVKAPTSPDDRKHRVKFGQGAGVDPLIREAFETRFGVPLIEAWGMTETSRAIINCELPRCLEPRAFGRPKPPWEVRVIDESGNSLPFETPGELLVRASGPNPRAGFFSGYLKLPAETERAWTGGWFHTGDIVSQRADGMLFFVDRRNNIVRRSGENISAAEIEEALVVLPQVRSVAVISVRDEFHDEEVMACIVLMPDIAPTLETAESIFDATIENLSTNKIPGWMAFLEQLPVTGTQKIRKGLIFGNEPDPRKDLRAIDLRERKRRNHIAFSVRRNAARQ